MTATKTPTPTRRGEYAFFGHPAGVATLFGTEMFERFSYYGMRALLVLYLSAPHDGGGLGLPLTTSIALYSVYNSAVYLAALPGGWIADRIMGGRRAVLYGGIVIMFGHIFLSVPGSFWAYLGLVFIAAGTGLLKPTISGLVGALYSPDDPRRDSGFSLFYLGINIGAFTAPLLTGFLAEHVNFHIAFLVAAIGMALSLVQYVFGWRWLGDIGLSPAAPLSAPERRTVFRKSLLWLGLAAAALVVHGAVVGGIGSGTIIDGMTILAFVVPVIILGRLTWRSSLPAQETAKVRAFAFLFIGAAIFWMVYDQGGSVLSLFAEHNTNRHILGFVIPTGWFQSIGSLMIIILAPVFAAMWLRMGSRQPSTIVKFALGLLFTGASFALMALAAQAASGDRLVSPLWLVGVFALQTIGELLLSPVGLSATTRLAPAGLTSQFLGLWFLATAVGNAAAAQLSRLTEKLSGPSYFLVVGAMAFAAGLAFLLIRRGVTALMGERGVAGGA